MGAKVVTCVLCLPAVLHSDWRAVMLRVGWVFWRVSEGPGGTRNTKGGIFQLEQVSSKGVRRPAGWSMSSLCVCSHSHTHMQTEREKVAAAEPAMAKGVSGRQHDRWLC